MCVFYNRFGIGGFPTIKFFSKTNKDGEEVIRIVSKRRNCS